VKIRQEIAMPRLPNLSISRREPCNLPINYFCTLIIAKQQEALLVARANHINKQFHSHQKAIVHNIGERHQTIITSEILL